MKNAFWIKSPNIETVSCFKNKILLNKPIKSAILKITSMGYYRVFVDNELITNNVFMPGWTSYLNRVQVQRYNLTNLFKNKQNITMDVYLAEGWGGAKQIAWPSRPYPYFEPSVIYSLKIVYNDGSIQNIISNENVDVYSTYILSSSIYQGEIQDANKEICYLGKALLSDVKTKLVKQQGEDIIEGEHIYPRSMFKTPKGELVIDFGQNFTGYINVKVKGNKGDKISFIPAEVLDKDGNFYNENYRAAKSLFSYILTGNNDDFKPLFSFQGLRYIKLLDYPKNISIDNFIGILVHSNLKRTGDFICGNQKINQLYHNVIYGQLSNYLDIPTDCPQRDERLGWLGDAQVFCKTAAINYNVHKFFDKWLTDMMLDQHKDGGLEGVIPIVPYCPIQVSAGWGDAGVICPWEIYFTYNDKKLLSKSYPMMKKWVDYLLTQCDKPYIFEREPQYGDWLALDAQYGSYVGSTSFGLVGTAFFAYSTSLLIKAAKILNKPYKKYERLYNNIKQAYQNEYLENGLPKGHIAMLNSSLPKTPYTQTGIALTLYFNLCEEKDKEKLANTLVELINNNEGRMTTGFLGTPYILHALSDNNKVKEAYDLLFAEKNPSWLFSVNMGATTMWEHYDGINEDGKFWSKDMNSFNHYAYGAVYDWIFYNAVGIRPIKEKYQEIIIKPLIDKRLGFVKGSYKLDEGEISVYWYLNEDNLTYEIAIPKGVIANIELVDGRKFKVENGKYTFSSKLDK